MKRLFTSCFGLGFMPIASGTWGSLPVAVIFGVMSYLGVSVFWITGVMAVLFAFGSFVCVFFGPSVIALAGKKDPGEIVADEFAGQAVTFLFLPMLGGKEVFIMTVGGFLLFRVFDIVKPWPIRRLEKLPEGWGVLCDDLLAGVYAAVVLQICVRFLF